MSDTARLSGDTVASLSMVMGVQRSGTTALFQSLARDPRVLSFDEGEGPLYGRGYFLLPEHASRQFLRRNNPIVTKPLNETKVRGVADVLVEFAEHAPQVIWIYRDPVNVFRSWIVEGWIIEEGASWFVHGWNVRNARMLSALSTHGARITVVRYEDLVVDRQVWRRTCKATSINGKYGFRGDSQGGRRKLSAESQTFIDAETRDVWNQLQAVRAARPRVVRALTSRYGISQLRNERQRQARWRAANTVVTRPDRSEPAARSPGDIPGARLWLDAQTIPEADGAQITHWPSRLGVEARAVPGRQGASRTTSLSGNTVVHFPRLGGADSGQPGSGFTCGSGDDWCFLYDGSPWTVIAVYRTMQNPSASEADVLLHTGDALNGGFAIGIFETGSHMCVITTVPAHGQAFAPVVMSVPTSIPGGANGWRVATWVHDSDCDTPAAPGTKRRTALSSFIGHKLVNASVAKTGRAYPAGTPSGPLHIGYRPGTFAGPFAGDIAELAIFSTALDGESRDAAIRYLLEKHGLQS